MKRILVITKENILMVVVFMILVSVVLCSVWGLYEQHQSYNAELEKEAKWKEVILWHVGEKVVIEKDTSLIVDVDFCVNHYVLSNGKGINFAFVTNKQKK